MDGLDEMWRHNRRAVKDIQDFCGFGTLYYLFEKAQGIDEEHHDIALTLFETGCRASELIVLRTDQFYDHGDFLEFRNVTVLKRGKAWMRNVWIRCDDLNPFTDALVESVEKKRRAGWTWMFPTKIPFTNTVNTDRHCSRIHIYRKVREVEDKTWPHWYRDMRARHLADYRFNNPKDPYALQAWFSWATVETASRYAGIKDEGIKKSMGITG